MNFEKPVQLFDFLSEAGQAAEPNRNALAQREGIDGCYYEGVHYINAHTTTTYNTTRSWLSRLQVDANPDSSKLRVVSNEISMRTQKSWSRTHPREFYIDAYPPDNLTGADSLFAASVHERVVNATLAWCRYQPMASDANKRRCIFGTRGMGLCIERHPQFGSHLKAFEFDTTNLILDPNCQYMDLCDHPWVDYTDVWSLRRIKDTFGVEIEESQARTFGELEATKVDMYALSGGKLFARYGHYKGSKGARVHQLHVKDTPYRFGKWYVVVELPGSRERWTWVNEKSTDSPFGGVGMPFALLHGYPRSDTMWSWGEPAQIRDEQDKTNLLETTKHRILQAYAPKWIADRRWFGTRVADDEISKQFNNQIGGVVLGDGSDRVRNAQPPVMVPGPQPPSFLADELERYSAKMLAKTHTSPSDVGMVKTHVAKGTVERALEDSGQVMAVRVAGDMRAHDYMIGIAHATVCRLAQDRDPGVLSMLSRAGLDDQDFGVVADTDWRNPGVVLNVNERSIRQRSVDARKQDLDFAASSGMITPEEYKKSAAGLEIPLDDNYRHMVSEARKAALRVVSGEVWRPMPLDTYSALYIDEFVRAQTLRQARQDPAALQRLIDAIESQRMLMLTETAQLAAAGQPDTGPSEPTEEDSTPEPQGPVSVADILDSLSGGAAEVGRQPAGAVQ